MTTKNMTQATVPTETVENNTEVVTPVSKETVKKREFKDSDPIKCKSITAGELGMIGLKTGINYTWWSRGQEIEVEYQDLVAAVRTGKKHVVEPFFIVTDPEFVSQFPQLEKLYASMYTIKDLKDVLSLKPADMKRTILALPDGAKNSIKSIASSEIANGNLDSVQKIRALDEIFNTRFMLMTELYN